eukprot:CAMPEP_0195295964 /NCGR_PEP_ID=MMETSP0707-20130614/18438_1 /TAXON_ID=33640 /ORGANISM="Asterionellopsis glacialis, Strain CCMP134" /LENGTH=538 /DNA_ID=CAMNT_0040357315 /DNA_START=147 /DNA_END=1760 /DNA_ORIENTATION=+
MTKVHVPKSMGSTGLNPFRTLASKRFCMTIFLMHLHAPGVYSSNFLERHAIVTSLSSTITRSIPALSTTTKRRNSNTITSNDDLNTIEVSTKTRTPRKLPKIDKQTIDQFGLGVYYGLQDNELSRTSSSSSPQRKRPPTRDETMLETLHELKMLREEMAALRQDMRRMKGNMGMDGDMDGETQSHAEGGITGMVHRRQRQREFDKIGADVEKWAEKILFEEDGEKDGWTEIICQKYLRKKFNPNNTIRCYIKYMKDSRGEGASLSDEDEYPCMKVYATIDAPLEDVCAYLAEENHLPDYNDLVVKHRDVEEISPHSKITWGQTPKILFIQPRDFVTYCHHRWLRDGTQVVVNQAVDHHPDVPLEGKDSGCRAHALRGANFISRDPEDPQKTRFALCAHAAPGGVPAWAVKTAVNALVPIEPFKLFYKIDKCCQNFTPSTPTQRTEMVADTLTGRSSRPAGLSQLGYACFWPNGGGMKEGVLAHPHPQHNGPPPSGDDASISEQEEQDHDSPSSVSPTDEQPQLQSNAIMEENEGTHLD